MQKYQLGIYSKNNECLAQTEWSEQAILVYASEYKLGDYIKLELETSEDFAEVQLEDSMLPAVLYLAGKSMRFDIPFDEQKIPYSPKSFSGNLHVISAKPANMDYVYNRRNLAVNPYDYSKATEVFPHASANIETRGEAVFAARNTIDGIYANSSHGEYPYTSWGINKNPNAELIIYLGKPCLIDEVRLTLRADFPHDNYWTKATLEFSNGTSETVELTKTALPQQFCFPEKKVEWVKLHKLIQSDEPSPFPALTQIELWGKICKNN